VSLTYGGLVLCVSHVWWPCVCGFWGDVLRISFALNDFVVRASPPYLMCASHSSSSFYFLACLLCFTLSHWLGHTHFSESFYYENLAFHMSCKHIAILGLHSLLFVAVAAAPAAPAAAPAPAAAAAAAAAAAPATAPACVFLLCFVWLLALSYPMAHWLGHDHFCGSSLL